MRSSWAEDGEGCKQIEPCHKHCPRVLLCIWYPTCTNKAKYLILHLTCHAKHISLGLALLGPYCLFLAVSYQGMRFDFELFLYISIPKMKASDIQYPKSERIFSRITMAQVFGFWIFESKNGMVFKMWHVLSTTDSEQQQNSR